MIELQIGIDGKVDQQSIILGNKFENQDEQIHFNLPPEFDSYNKYIIAVYRQDGGDITKVLPVNDNIFIITSTLTHKSGRWYLYLMCRQHELNLDDSEVDISAQNGEHVFISDGFIGMVATNYIDKNLVDNTPLDANLKVVYDDLLTVKQEVETKLANGDFDGHSPIVTIGENENWYIDDVDSGKPSRGRQGETGKSAYEVAIEQGFEGTEQEWLDSLKYQSSPEFNQLAQQVRQDANTASTKANEASHSAASIESVKQTVEQLASQTQSYATSAEQQATSAQQSAQSASEAAKSASDAANSASGSATSAQESASSASDSASSAQESATSASESADSASSAQTYAQQASESATQAQQSAIDAEQEADRAQSIADSIQDFKDVDSLIEKLAIKETAEGNPTIINDSADWRMQSLNVYGQSSQDGTPTPETPVEIISKEISQITVTNGADLSQTITLSEPNTLRGIPVDNGGNVTIDGQQYISDVICEKDGVIGVERNTAELVIDGSDIKFSSSPDNKFWNLPHQSSIGIRLVGTSFYKLNNYFNNLIFGANEVFDFIFIYAERATEYFTDINDFNDFISMKNTEGDPLKIVYPIEPTFEPLPEEVQAQYKALKSYYPNTVIQTGCWNEVEYVADTQKWIEKKFDELNASLVATQSALLDKER